MPAGALLRTAPRQAVHRKGARDTIGGHGTGTGSDPETTLKARGSAVIIAQHTE
jgi:hypothetical protein